MLTGLRFKNWRSLRDVTIDDLTPITVFVGANSSGKSNILDALHFIRYAVRNGLPEAVYAWHGEQKIRTVGSDENELEVHAAYSLPDGAIARTFRLQMNLFRGVYLPLYSGTTEKIVDEYSRYIDTLIERRWQLLRENFHSPVTLPSNTEPGDLYIVDTMAQNVPQMLDFMRKTTPLHSQLQDDLVWLLSYIESVDTMRDERETRVVVRESLLQGQEAPTISGGTSRILAMLTAYYALDMRDASLPGLVVIEEPDTAIHPLLLGKLVSLMRQYTSREDAPRQFILTTHNPMLLNLFKPEEVRIVERDEHGETTVRPFDPAVVEAWRKEEGAYNLGDLWTTRLAGGVPE